MLTEELRSEGIASAQLTFISVYSHQAVSNPVMYELALSSSFYGKESRGREMF